MRSLAHGLPDNARDKWAAREHDFLTGDLSHRALQARGMRLSTPDFLGIQARRARLRQEWARFFKHIDVVLCPPAPTGPIRHDQKPDPHSRSIEVNGKQRPYFDLMLWACAGWLVAQDPNHRRELRGPHGDRLRRDARSTRRMF